MNSIKRFFLLLIFVILLYSIQSCGDAKTRQTLIKQESEFKFSEAIKVFSKYRPEINIDSLTTEYKKISFENIEAGYDYAKKLYNISKPILKSVNDSIELVKQAEINKQYAEEQNEWFKTKPGKIQKKHPQWTREECRNLDNKKIWIGMSLDMLKYLRGNPNRANPSNFGKGVNWQWCWDDYTPSCFYGAEDGIITSYN